MKVWNVADGKFVRSFEGHTHHVLGVTWRADGRMLVSSGADNVIKVWDTRTGDQLRTVQNQFTKEVTSVTFVGDSDTVVAVSGDARVRLMNAGQRRQRPRLPRHDRLHVLRRRQRRRQDDHRRRPRQRPPRLERPAATGHPIRPAGSRRRSDRSEVGTPGSFTQRRRDHGEEGNSIISANSALSA